MEKSSESVNELRLPSILSDHMVLQAGRPITLWGWAVAGCDVEVFCEWTNRVHKTAALTDGSWLIDVIEIPSGKSPYSIKVISSDKQIELNDIIFGEVWLAAGQSNMDMLTKDAVGAESELKDADYNNIRMFKVNASLSPEKPLTDINGKWIVCTPESASTFSAVGFFFSRKLNRNLNIPVGVIQSSYGGTAAEAWVRTQALECDPELSPILSTWKRWIDDYPKTPEEQEAATVRNEAQLKAEGKTVLPWRPIPKGPEHHHRPAGVFNAMIYPLTSYRLTGVIWYQGEANAWRAYQYRKLLPALIDDWRRLWNNVDMRFLIVQLPGFDINWLEKDVWPEMREAQSVIASTVPRSGIVCSLDVGDPNDLHPRRKLEIGERLADLALAKNYGKKVAYSGPVYRSMNIRNNVIQIVFDHADGLFSKDGEPTGFTIAGNDRKFRPAKAYIENNKICINSDVKNISAVRYCWENSPSGNLFNEAGLPAFPFRTDNWPSITEGRTEPDPFL